jgi:NADH dehydrogenase
MKQRVVIVGGGFAGVKAALSLSDAAHFEIILITNRTHFEYHGALYRTATGHSPTEVVIPLRDIFQTHPQRNRAFLLNLQKIAEQGSRGRWF